MPKNSSGVYSKPAGTTAVSGATISSSKYNELADDLGTAVSESLDTQGRNGMTGPLKVSDGSVTAPAIALTSEPDRGFYKTTNGWGVTIDGVKVGEFTSAGVLDGSGNVYQTAATVAWTDTASAATVDLSAIASENIRITGTTTITALDDVVSPAASGVTKTLRFSGALTLTHNATSLILPTAANITTAAGDTCTASSLGSGNWVVTDYMRATGLPLASGTPSSTTFLRGDGSWATPAGITAGTAAASTSGTVVDFTGLPTTVRRLTVALAGVSTSSTSPIAVRIGSGSVQTTGYQSSAGYGASSGTQYDLSTAAFNLVAPSAIAGSGAFSGLVTLVHLGSNVWAASWAIGGVQVQNAGGGTVTLSGALDRVRLTTLGGTDTFDAGSVNILYE